LAIDLAESELDSFLDEGVLKEIPGIKVIIACKKTWGAIHDRLFLRKVSDFLRSSAERSENHCKSADDRPSDERKNTGFNPASRKSRLHHFCRSRLTFSKRQHAFSFVTREDGTKV